MSTMINSSPDVPWSTKDTYSTKENSNNNEVSQLLLYQYHLLKFSSPFLSNKMKILTKSLRILNQYKISMVIRRKLLETFGQYIKNLNNVISFSLTYQVNNLDEEIIYIILYTHNINKLAKQFNECPCQISHIQGFRIKFILQNYDLQEDHPEETHNPILHTGQDKLIWEALQETQNVCFNEHSNVIGVTVGCIKNTQNPCINVFLHSKGYIPLGEQSIPKFIQNIPVRVIEGRYHVYPSKIEDEYDIGDPAGNYRFNEVITPGCSIGISNTSYIGTLGAILMSNDNSINFLTNHHVVIDACNPIIGENIIQPAMGDYKREKIFDLKLKKQQLEIKKRKSAVEDMDLTCEIEKLSTIIRNNDPSITYEEKQQCIIGTVSDRNILDSRICRVKIFDKVQDIKIGIDAALVSFNGNRLLSTNDHFRDPKGYHLATCTKFINFGDIFNDEDIVYKSGRTTGITRGHPTSNPGGVVKRNLGEYRYDKTSNFTFVHDRTPKCSQLESNHKHTIIPLWNQYLIRHPSSKPSFVQPGDSGALCYIQLISDPDISKHKYLYPWGLLNGILISSIISYGIASPIEAIMQKLGENTMIITDENKTQLP